jgi:hypothetical protein
MAIPIGVSEGTETLFAFLQRLQLFLLRNIDGQTAILTTHPWH